MNITTIPVGRSPYEARLNNKRKGTRSRTEIRHQRALPIKAVGESETCFTPGRPAVHFKFCFGEGRHFKPAGGGMRNKAKRRTRLNNYVRPAMYFNQYLHGTKDVMDREHRSFGVLSFPDGVKDADWDSSVDGVALMAYTAGKLSDEEFDKIRARKENGMDVKDCLALIKERWSPRGVLSNL